MFAKEDERDMKPLLMLEFAVAVVLADKRRSELRFLVVDMMVGLVPFGAQEFVCVFGK